MQEIASVAALPRKDTRCCPCEGAQQSPPLSLREIASGWSVVNQESFSDTALAATHAFCPCERSLRSNLLHRLYGRLLRSLRSLAKTPDVVLASVLCEAISSYFNAGDCFGRCAPSQRHQMLSLRAKRSNLLHRLCGRLLRAGRLLIQVFFPFRPRNDT